jgi:hypothetical protein
MLLRHDLGIAWRDEAYDVGNRHAVCRLGDTEVAVVSITTQAGLEIRVVQVTDSEGMRRPGFQSRLRSRLSSA